MTEKAPERIWMDPDIKFPECEKQYGSDVEYVRADRIEELEAKLEKAVEALEKLSTAQLFGCGEVLGLLLSESAMGREILARMKFARTTLAELTGGKDE